MKLLKECHALLLDAPVDIWYDNGAFCKACIDFPRYHSSQNAYF